MLCTLIGLVLFVVLLALLAVAVAGAVIAAVAGGNPTRMLELALLVKDRFKPRA